MKSDIKDLCFIEMVASNHGGFMPPPGLFHVLSRYGITKPKDIHRV